MLVNVVMLQWTHLSRKNNMDIDYRSWENYNFCFTDFTISQIMGSQAQTIVEQTKTMVRPLVFRSNTRVLCPRARLSIAIDLQLPRFSGSGFIRAWGPYGKRTRTGGKQRTVARFRGRASRETTYLATAIGNLPGRTRFYGKRIRQRGRRAVSSSRARLPPVSSSSSSSRSVSGDRFSRFPGGGGGGCGGIDGSLR